VPASETVNSSLFASGRAVDIAGTVDGDVFCAGQNVTISGTVKGDVICAGQNITVSGTVEGDVRLAGQTVTIGGQVAQNASVATSAFSLEGRAKIGGDLSAAGSDLILNGEVGRDASLAGATATLNNRIGRNVNASVNDIRLRGQATVGGGLFYTSPKDAELAEGSQVAGETRRTESSQKKGAFEAPFVTGMGFVVYLIISLLLLSLALLLLFPTALRAVTDVALASPLKVLLTGFVASLAAPVLIVILMVTVLGIPLALLLAVIWLLILFLAGPAFSYYVGRSILKGQYSPFIVMALGALVVLVLLFVPILGAFVWLVTIWMGVGMILLELVRRTPKPSYALAEASRPRKKS
jgi:cytoskeletal protein CcmA (bactofilin family)